MELRHWTQADAMELTSLCNAVDRRFLSDRLPNPYTEKNAKEWLPQFGIRKLSKKLVI